MKHKSDDENENTHLENKVIDEWTRTLFVF